MTKTSAFGRVVLIRVVLIFFLSATAGGVYDVFSGDSLFWGNLDYQEGAQQELTLEEARRLFDNGMAIFIDARSALEYSLGHIPGALNLPYDKFDEMHKDVLSPFPKENTLISYCSGQQCQSSIKLQSLIKSKTDFVNVQTFYGGWQAWQSAQYPIVKGDLPK